MESKDIKALNVWQRIHHAGTLLHGRVAKDGRNEFDKYDYATHDGVVAFVRGALQESRVVLTLNPVEFSVEPIETSKSTQMLCRGLMIARITNIDTPTDFYEINVPVYALDRGDKAYGKAISYGKKYAINALIGLLLATGEDSDSDTATITQPEKATHKAQQDAPKAQKVDEELRHAKRELENVRNEKGLSLEALKVFATQQTGKDLSKCNAKEIETITAKLIIGDIS